ncbi:MAG: Ig-like domain-containing protein [bacterium]
MRSAVNCTLSLVLMLVVHAILLFCHIPLAYTMDVMLEWTENTGQDIAGYKVYYTADPAGSPYDGTEALEGDSPINVGKVSQYILTGLSTIRNYRFVVTAYDSLGRESDYSNEVVFTTMITDITSSYDGSFTAGADIPISIHFSEPVTLTGGNLIVTLNTGYRAEVMPFAALVNTSIHYIVQAGDTTNGLNVISLILSDSATLCNDQGNACALLLPPGNNLADNTDIVIDTKVPSAPANLNLAADDDSGISDSDHITRKTSGLTITGSGEDMAIVQLYDNGIAMTEATEMVSRIGFSIDLSLPDGTHAITARQRDAAGNISDSSGRLNITIDTASPGVALSYSDPGPYRPADVVEVTATFTEEIPQPPQLTITYAASGTTTRTTTDTAADTSTAHMIATAAGRIWVHSLTIPSGYEGTASILIIGTDRAGNRVESYAGDQFTYLSGIQAGKESGEDTDNLLPDDNSLPDNDGDGKEAPSDGKDDQTPDAGEDGCFINSLSKFRVFST